MKRKENVLNTLNISIPTYSLMVWKSTSKVAMTISWLIVAFPITAPNEISTAAEQKSATNRLEEIFKMHSYYKVKYKFYC